MAYDPRDIYKRLLAQLGAVGSTVSGEGEFAKDPSGQQWVNANVVDPADVYRKLGTGWDTSAVYKTDTGADRYASGEVPPWMKQQLEGVKALYGSGGLSRDDIAGLWNHLVGGQGIDPVWAAGRGARPGWLDSYLRGWFKENLRYSPDQPVAE